MKLFFEILLFCYFAVYCINWHTCSIFQLLQVLRNKPDFRRKPWPTISNSAKDFVRKLLVKDPRARLTAAQALCMFLFVSLKKYLSVLLQEVDILRTDEC